MTESGILKVGNSLYYNETFPASEWPDRDLLRQEVMRRVEEQFAGGEHPYDLLRAGEHFALMPHWSQRETVGIRPLAAKITMNSQGSFGGVTVSVMVVPFDDVFPEFEEPPRHE